MTPEQETNLFSANNKIQELEAAQRESPDLLHRIKELEAEVYRLKEDILVYKSFQNFHNPMVEELKATVEVMRDSLQTEITGLMLHSNRGETEQLVKQLSDALSLHLIQKTKAKMEAMERVIEAAEVFVDVLDNGHPTHCDLWPNPPLSDKCTCGADVILDAENKLDEALLAYQELEKG